jgi:hypothetical protein
MSAKEVLTCGICKEIFKNPVILLCCSETVCKKHIDDMVNNSINICFTCSLCFKEQEATREFYLVDKKTQALVERDFHNICIL